MRAKKPCGVKCDRFSVCSMFMLTSYSIHIKVNFISLLLHTREWFFRNNISSRSLGSPYPRLISHVFAHPDLIFCIMCSPCFTYLSRLSMLLAIHISSNLHFKRISKQIASPFLSLFFFFLLHSRSFACLSPNLVAFTFSVLPARSLRWNVFD